MTPETKPQHTGGTFREVDGKPIFYRDKSGTVHACEGADVHRGVRLIWTLCEQDVPANAAYKADADNVTCAKCAAIAKATKASDA